MWMSELPPFSRDCRAKFGVTSNAAVIRKALALANVAAGHADADNSITLAATEGKPEVKVLLDE